MYKTAREYLRLPICKEMVEQYKSTIDRGSINVKKVSFADLPNDTIEIKKPTTKLVNNLQDPQVWGPSFWFTLHNSSLHYPQNPTNYIKNAMKYRILAIPYELPCENCKQHAQAFIQSRDLNNAVKSQKNLFKFYVDFHNEVNKRYNKRVISYKEAEKIWSGSDPNVQIKCNLIEFK
jgi:hypothetical protein